MSDNLPERRAAIVANENLVRLDIEQMQRFAIGYARAGVFQGDKYKPATMEELFVRISAGQAIGLDPYTSVSEMFMVKGRLEMSTNLQLALAKSSGKYDYRIEWGDLLEDAGVTKEDVLREGLELATVARWPKPRWCKFTVYEKDSGERTMIGETTFTLVDAHRAGLLLPSRNGEPSNHLKYPRNMLKNRAGSNAIDFFMPDATIIRTYGIGEISNEEWGPSTVTAEVVRDDPQPSSAAAGTAAAEEEIQDAEVMPDSEDEAVHQASMDQVRGEMREGESAAEAMERMVREEAETFNPATEPPPPVVQPPPTVETSEHDPVISPSQLDLFWVKVNQAGLTDERRYAITTELTGQKHSNRIPARLFSKVLERLDAEIQIRDQEPGGASTENTP